MRIVFFIISFVLSNLAYGQETGFPQKLSLTGGEKIRLFADELGNSYVTANQIAELSSPVTLGFVADGQQGLSKVGTDLRLGQDVDAVFGPAVFLSNRYIPMGEYTLKFESELGLFTPFQISGQTGLLHTGGYTTDALTSDSLGLTETENTYQVATTGEMVARKRYLSPNTIYVDSIFNINNARRGDPFRGWPNARDVLGTGNFQYGLLDEGDAIVFGRGTHDVVFWGGARGSFSPYANNSTIIPPGTVLNVESESGGNFFAGDVAGATFGGQGSIQPRNYALEASGAVINVTMPDPFPVTFGATFAPFDHQDSRAFLEIGEINVDSSYAHYGTLFRARSNYFDATIDKISGNVYEIARMADVSDIGGAVSYRINDGAYRRFRCGIIEANAKANLPIVSQSLFSFATGNDPNDTLVLVNSSVAVDVDKITLLGRSESVAVFRTADSVFNTLVEIHVGEVFEDSDFVTNAQDTIKGKKLFTIESKDGQQNFTNTFIDVGQIRSENVGALLMGHEANGTTAFENMVVRIKMKDVVSKKDICLQFVSLNTLSPLDRQPYRNCRISVDDSYFNSVEAKVMVLSNLELESSSSLVFKNVTFKTGAAGTAAIRLHNVGGAENIVFEDCTFINDGTVAPIISDAPVSMVFKNCFANSLVVDPNVTELVSPINRDASVK